MQKAAIIVLADTDTIEGLGRVANALTAVTEFKDAGDDIKLIFDGAGVKWVPELSHPGHKYHDVFERVRDQVGGVCKYCAGAFNVSDQVEQAGFPFADDFKGHPSFRQLIAEGYQIITF